jgi:hypothetical protein
VLRPRGLLNACGQISRRCAPMCPGRADVIDDDLCSSPTGVVGRSALSQRLMTWWRGVLTEGHRPSLQIRVVQEPVHEPGRSADAIPVIVP